MFNTNNNQPGYSRHTLSIDYRVISLVLFLVLAVCVFLWKPWAPTAATTRKITVSGTATVKGIPDEYQMNPYYEFTGLHAKNVTDATAMSDQVTAKLKELGVKDSEISSNTNAYDKYAPNGAETNDETLQLSYTIKLSSKDKAQKVQDYFLTTTAKGQFSPYATFSQNKQKELDGQARSNAIVDAKARAQKTASEVDAKIGKVVTVSDGSSSGGGCGPYGLCAGANLSTSAVAVDSVKESSIPIQSGQNEFTTTVQVEYELR